MMRDIACISFHKFVRTVGINEEGVCLGNTFSYNFCKMMLVIPVTYTLFCQGLAFAKRK